MEKLRTDRLGEVATYLQKNIRRFLARKRYLRTIELITRLQQIARTKAAKREMERLRQERAATIIQTYWRCYAARKWYLRQRATIIQIQAAARALVGRKHFGQIRQHNAATQIQKIVRGWFARRQYQTQRNHIVRIQTCIRRRNARKQLVVMRAEARSVSHFKEVSYKLETKVNELTQNLAQQKEDKARLRTKATELETHVRSWISKYDDLDERAKNLSKVIDKPGADSDQWSSLHQQRDALKNEYMTSLNKIKLQDKEIARLTEELSRQKEEIAQLKQVSTDTAQKPLDDTGMAELKKQIASLKTQLSQTLGSPRKHQQQQQQQQTITKATTNNTSRNRRRHSARRLSATPDASQAAKTPNADPNDPLYTLLQDEALLQEDILDGLIRTFKIPESTVEQPLSLKEKTLPARVLGFSILRMWKRGYLAESERWLYAIMETIERHCQVNRPLNLYIYIYIYILIIRCVLEFCR